MQCDTAPNEHQGHIQCQGHIKSQGHSDSQGQGKVQPSTGNICP